MVPISPQSHFHHQQPGNRFPYSTIGCMEQLDLFDDPLAGEFDLEEVFDVLNRRHWGGELSKFRCEWSHRMISTWGACYRRHRVIRISSLFKQRPLRELEALLCHEMIHIKHRGHGRMFKRELKRIGLAGDVQKRFPHLNEISNSLRRPYRYTYQCGACGARIQRRRRIRGYCAACHARGFRSSFRLVHEEP